MHKLNLKSKNENFNKNYGKLVKINKFRFMLNLKHIKTKKNLVYKIKKFCHYLRKSK